MTLWLVVALVLSPLGAWDCGNGYCRPLQETELEAVFLPGPTIHKPMNLEATETRRVETGIFLLLRDNHPVRSYLCERDALNRWLCTDLR